MVRKSLTRQLEPEEQIVVAQIRLEILRFALSMSSAQGLPKVMEAAKEFDQFCFVDGSGVYLEFDTKGHA